MAPGPMFAPGDVLALVLARARAQTQAEWEADLAGIWDRAFALLAANAGFKGMLGLWNDDDSRRVSIIGVWDSLAHRLAYEAGPARDVRALFDSIFEAVPDRPRYVVSRVASLP